MLSTAPTVTGSQDAAQLRSGTPHFSPTGLWIDASAALALLVSGQSAIAQDVRMPCTLRYGSGLIVKQEGTEIEKRRDAYNKQVSDGSIAFGLMNRVEPETSIEHFDSEKNGGNMLGAFARISLLPASMKRFGLAAGARFVTSPPSVKSSLY